MPDDQNVWKRSYNVVQKLNTSLGPFINYVTLEGGGGVLSVWHFVSGREGVWSMHIHAWVKIVSIVLLALVLYLMALVVWFWFFIGRLSRFCRLFSVFFVIHSYIYHELNISDTITLKCLIVVIRIHSLFAPGPIHSPERIDQ